MSNQLVWNGLNFEELQRLTDGACLIENDGETLAVRTSEGLRRPKLGDKVVMQDNGVIAVRPGSQRQKQMAQEEYEAFEKLAQKSWQLPNAHENFGREPTVRMLIRQLQQRIGRIQAARGEKLPPLVVLSQDLREHELGMGDHPAMDDDTP